ncbi:Zeta toxin [Pirellulimonas nuda]|uniref:Zeta toxin n=1 Tax=Pirellulimonas nuda TaxID=2528009 RepID=A0A518DGE7_9BACT|nr:zeta toxin family protein [Pirellulimonas nuda]QDU90547.1 Zeta toxin [Pirellulimonas nuda]
MNDAPRITVVGGPNGAGKTTFVRAYLEEYPEPYLSADAIAAELRPEAVEEVAVAAGRLFVERLAELIGLRSSFIVESTLSGKSLAANLKAARKVGYRVSMVMVYVDSADASLQRVKERHRKGGHNVPEEDVRRRFSRTLKNFWNLYRPLADEWKLYRNALNSPQLVASGEQDKLTPVNDAELARYFTLAEVVEHE